MINDKEYYAFISYSHKDEEWAKWLQHEFEHYHLPTTLNGRPDVPDTFRPIFRDIDELSGGELKPQISHALSVSAYLVIICSPHSAQSPYVDEEIREFIQIGERNGVNNLCNIFPFIIAGIPHSKENPAMECFPQALRDLPSELIAGDVTKHGREHAFVKILSGTLHHSNVGFSMLWNQFERDRIEAERKERERRDKLLLLESRYLSEKALDIASVDSKLARMLVLRALPKKVEDPEDRPYCLEAESALRRIINYKSEIINTRDAGISSFGFSSHGNYSILSFSDGTVMIWDMESGERKVLPLEDGIIHDVASICCSHFGKVAAFYCKDHTLTLLNLDTGKRVGKVSIGTIRSDKLLAFTYDDKFLIVLSDARRLQIWNVEDLHLVYEIPVSDSNDIAIDRENRWIALATLDFSIEIIDFKRGKRIKKISKAHTHSLTSVDFAPEGTILLTGSFDGRYKLWDWMRGKELLSRSVGKVTMLSIPDGDRELYGALATELFSAKYSTDGKLIVTASGDGFIRIWSAVTGEQKGATLGGHRKSVTSAYFNRDASIVVSSSPDDTIRVWDLMPKVPYKSIGRARSFPFMNNKSSGHYQLDIDKFSGTVKVMDTESETVLKSFEGNGGGFNNAFFSLDGSFIAVTANDKTARIWNFETGEQIGPTLVGHTETPNMAAFSPDGKLLVTGSAKELKVWDVNSGIQIGPDLTCFDDFYMVVFAENGTGIISELNSDYDVLFEWEPLQELIDRVQNQVSDRQFSDEEIRRYYLT